MIHFHICTTICQTEANKRAKNQLTDPRVKYRRKYVMFARILKFGECEIVEVAHQTSRDRIATTTRWPHRTDEVHIHELAKLACNNISRSSILNNNKLCIYYWKKNDGNLIIHLCSTTPTKLLLVHQIKAMVDIQNRHVIVQ